MLELRPELSRFYHDLSTRFHSGLHNIRSFGHQITTRFHNDNGSTNQSPSSNPFLNSPNDNNNTLNVACSTNSSSSNTRRSNRRSSSRHQHRHNHHSQSLCVERENHRQAYRPYLFNSHHGNNNNNNNNVSIIHRNGLITVGSYNDDANKDRNVLAAILSIIVIAIMATALVQPKWFSIYNDLCVPQRYFTKTDNSIDKVNTIDESSSSSLPSSIFDFQQSSQYTQYRPQYYYNNGPYYSSYALTPVTIYGLTPDFKTCANAQILALKRTIIGLCFLAIMCTLVQFFMDTMGTGRRKWLNSMRQFSVGNIVCVLLCVLIIGLCYFISVLYERVQLQQLFNSKTTMSQQQPNAVWIKSRMINRATVTTTTASGGVGGQPLDYLTIHQIEVKFELSYYLVTLAGFLSILASAANLFRRPRQIFIERISGLNDCNGHHYHNRSLMARHSRSTSNGNHNNHNNNNNNGDENSLLSSDVLLNNSLESSPTSPYSFANDFTANWALYCDNNHSVNNRIMPQRTLPQPPILPQSSCPPPPPYSP